MNDDAGFAVSNDAVHLELAAIEDDWMTAILSNDADRIGSFTADDWVIVSDSGITAREHFLAAIRSGKLTHSAMAATVEPRIRTYADTAIITTRVISTAHYQGRRLDADEWTTDIFVRCRDSRWLCQLTHITAAAPPGS